MKKNDLLLFSLMMNEAADHDDEEIFNCRFLKALDFLASKICSDIFPIDDLSAPFIAFILGEYKDAIEKTLLDEEGKQIIKDLQSTVKNSFIILSNKPPQDMEDKQ